MGFKGSVQGAGFGRFWRGLFQSILDLGGEKGILWNRPLQNRGFQIEGLMGSQAARFWVLGFYNPILWHSPCPEVTGSGLAGSLKFKVVHNMCL